MLSHEQVKRVEEIRADNVYRSGDRHNLYDWRILDDQIYDFLSLLDSERKENETLRKQLNAAVLLGQAAASLNKPMTDAEFMGSIKE